MLILRGEKVVGAGTRLEIAWALTMKSVTSSAGGSESILLV